VDQFENQNKWNPFKEESSDENGSVAVATGSSYFHIEFKDTHEDYGIFLFHWFDETKRVTQISFQAADGQTFQHPICNENSNYCAPKSWDFVGAYTETDTGCDAFSNWQVLCSETNQIVYSEDEQMGCYVYEADRDDYNCLGIRINKVNIIDSEGDIDNYRQLFDDIVFDGSNGLVAVRNIKMEHIIPAAVAEWISPSD